MGLGVATFNPKQFEPMAFLRVQGVQVSVFTVEESRGQGLALSV